MFRFIAAVMATLLVAAIPAAAEAARVAPMMVSVTPLGRGTVARIELSNPGDSTFPVEVQMFRGEISETGELQLSPADEDFLVFPPQTIVQAGSQQVFRVQYIGEPELATSQIYYMQIRQIPVELTPGQSQVQVVVNFNVLINVVPDGTSAKPTVALAKPAMREDVQGVEVRVVNAGTRYFTASSFPWEISGRAADGTEVSIRRTPAEMNKIIGVGVVAPGRARIFFVPTETPLVEGSVKVTLAP